MSNFNITYNTDILIDYDKNRENYITKNYLTKYEKTKIIGLRAQQIATGSPVFTDVPDGMMNPIDIANKELNERKIPFILKRNVGNNKYEYWKLEDLIY
tara:strand:- start:4034 stop:4330 length:297 start_codon:yes stop_codon:yes gene_type:complete